MTKGQDRYGWYRKGPISPDFEIDEVLPHLFDKSIKYVQERAKSGKPFFLYLPLPAPHTPIVPVPPFKDASGINPYADFVMQVDHHMGELLKTVKMAGIDENTLVFFTSDNGCSPEGNFPLLKEKGHDPSAGFRGHKADIYEGGHRVPLTKQFFIAIGEACSYSCSFPSAPAFSTFSLQIHKYEAKFDLLKGSHVRSIFIPLTISEHM